MKRILQSTEPTTKVDRIFNLALAASLAWGAIGLGHAEVRQVKLGVEGMSCGNCAQRITKKLKEMPGVSRVGVAFKTKSAEIEFDDTKVAESQIRGEIEGLGYKVKP